MNRLSFMPIVNSYSLKLCYEAVSKHRFFYDLCKHHVSGQLRVAPEHVSDNVLKYMGKPSKKVYDKFSEKFYEINRKRNKC